MSKMRARIVTAGLIGATTMLTLDVAKAEQVGHASWYAVHSRTASGEQMNPSDMTAAHRSLPFGTKVLVENLSNGRSVVVRINDRGPFVGGRIIDVSKAAASTLGILGSGTAKVRVSTAGGGSSVAGGYGGRIPGGILRGASQVTRVASRHSSRQGVAEPRTASRHDARARVAVASGANALWRLG
jgi:rare lipoprotein A